ncbi:TrbI/VirB10 family protein [Pseudomonas aeruginosa]|uniref:TrbI/VirB10 family protein n=1 Tax=Pseudomonas aeruginosa TaxID=287 RepID=UPI0015E67804|nr:TrbI/VirB10 family protein [Pseudomonas aeruginosa]
MANNPYADFDENAEAKPLQNETPEPIVADRGEPTTKGPRKKKKGVVIAVVAIILFSLIGVGMFGLFFYRAVTKGKTDAAQAVQADPALEQKASTGPDLGAYQQRVAKQMEDDRKRREAEEARNRAAAGQGQQQGGQQQAQTGAAGGPSLGNYQGQGQGASNAGGRPAGRKKPEDMTPEEQAAARRWEHDVLWDEKNATGGPGQQNAARSGQSMDKFYSQASRNQNGRGSSNPTFEERMAANPYLNGAGGAGSGGSLGGGGDSNSIGGMLATENFPAGTAQIRPDLKFLLIHGTTIPCVMLPRIVTNYPGQTRCMINRDVYSADGSVVLMGAGSIANGERKVSMKQGIAKVFVAWRDVETPDGVTVRFDSMAADQLGAAGLDAWIDNHYAERFGGAILLSLLDDTFQAIADQARSGDGVTFDSSTNNAQDMASIALENSINIPPTGYVNQATESTIIVARDVDFRSVYGVQ